MLTKWVLYGIIATSLGMCYWCHTLAIALLSPEVSWICDMPLAIDFFYLCFILLLGNLSRLHWGLYCPSKCQRISTRQQLSVDLGFLDYLLEGIWSCCGEACFLPSGIFLGLWWNPQHHHLYSFGQPSWTHVFTATQVMAEGGIWWNK